MAIQTMRTKGWTFGLAGSLVLLGASLGLLAATIYEQYSGKDGATAPPTIELPVATPTAGAGDRIVRYSTVLPITVDSERFQRAAPGMPADLRIVTTGPGNPDSIALRYFVPIVSPWQGVYELSLPQLLAAMSGGADWADFGGLAGAVRPVSPPRKDLALVEGWLDVVDLPAPSHSTYGELVEAVAGGKGMVALVPLEYVNASVTALAVDGVDLVRGRGDPSLWPFRATAAVQALSPVGIEARAALATAAAAHLPQPITVVLTGDILQSRCTLERIQASGDWGSPLRTPVGEFLAAADLALGSLDGSIQDINPPWGCVVTTNLSSPPETIEALTLAGFDGLTVATNHVFDCGQDYCGNRAFVRTLELLGEAGLKYWGGGLNLEEALAPGLFQVEGISIGVLGFDDVAAYELEATDTSPGTAPLDDDYSEERAAGEPSFYRPAAELGIERFRQRIADLSSKVDVVIVQVQSGTEETHSPSPRSLKALRAAVDAGADIVVGNQAHWVQAVEYGPDSFVAYALGNFIFDQTWTPEHTEGVLLEATLHGSRLVNVRFWPYVIEERFRPEFVEGGRALKILGDIVTASDELAASGR